VRAVVYTVLLASIVQYVPALARWRFIGRPADTATAILPQVPQPKAVVGEAALLEESHGDSANTRQEAHPAPVAAGVIAATEPTAGPTDLVDAKPPPVHIEDPQGRGLTHFYQALKRTSRREKDARTRIVHFGDSLIASDYVSGTLRRMLQKQFGDAGHGFSLIANAWPSYFHEGVTRFATSGWLVSRVVGPYAQDGWYGLGGVSFRAPVNTLARIGTGTRGEFGRNVSRFELAYVASPDGGTIRVRIDQKPVGELSTRHDEKVFKTTEWRVEDGSHEIEFLTTRGTSRLFGVVMEREVPGVVLDAIGIQGARLRFLDQQDDSHYASQLKWRTPDLVIYEFGANESADGLAYSLKDFHETMKAVVLQQTAALPESSCLVIGAMDRATRKGDTVSSSSFIPMLVAEQRSVAMEVGCAFFDTYQAMGGLGSMPRWVKRGLGQADLTHPTAVGADIIGTWIYRALMERWQ
jgi:lysophospholipase L1-like esterase